MMDCKMIIVAWLRERNFDGLCEPDTEFGCGLDDFSPCGDGSLPHCKPANKRILQEGEYVGYGKPGDVVYCPNVELTGAARLYRAASSDRRERG
jgi:hypothetical protein